MKTNRIGVFLAGLLVVFGIGAGGFALNDEGNIPQPTPQVNTEYARTATLKSRLETVEGQLQQTHDLLDNIFGQAVEPDGLQTVPVTITAYSSTVDQCDSTPYIAANNKPVRVGTLAVSRDLLEEFGIEYGQRVLIPGYGIFEVRDTMNARWQRRVDIWESDRQAARMFGKQQGKLIWMPLGKGSKMITIAQSE
ncbi:MAG: hypothetical protein R6V08_09435 [Desulfuromonadales bacterium]